MTNQEPLLMRSCPSRGTLAGMGSAAARAFAFPTALRASVVGLHGPLGKKHRHATHPALRLPGFLSGTGQARNATVEPTCGRLNDDLTGLWAMAGSGQEATFHPWQNYGQTKMKTEIERAWLEVIEEAPGAVIDGVKGLFLNEALLQKMTAAIKPHLAFDPSEMPLPQWLPRGAWGEWCADRKQRRKAITKRAALLQINSLHQYMNEGHAPADVIKHSIAGGYQGLFAPRASTSTEPAWRREQRERTQFAAPGVASGALPAAQFFDIEAESVRRIK